jgi:hypothetical protein
MLKVDDTVAAVTKPTEKLLNSEELGPLLRISTADPIRAAA